MREIFDRMRQEQYTPTSQENSKEKEVTEQPEIQKSDVVCVFYWDRFTETGGKKEQNRQVKAE